MRRENREVLARRRPDLLERLKGAGGFRVEAGPKGKPVLVGPDGPATSRYDPAKEADRAAREVTGGEGAVVFVFGFGLGDLPRAVLAKRPDAVVVYEPHAGALRAALEAVDVSDVLSDERCTLLVGRGEAAEEAHFVASQLDRIIDPVRSERFERAVLPSAHGAAEAIGPRLEEAWLRGLSRILTSFHHELLWLHNAVRNLLAAPRAAPEAAQPLAGRAAVLVGAGPSLAKNLDVLVAHRDRAVVVAVDTALRALTGAGLVPDVVVSVDANPANELDLAGVPEAVFAESLLAADVVSVPRYFEAFESAFVFRTRNFCLGPDGRPEEKPMGVSWLIDRLAPEVPSWQSGGSVSTNALSLLTQWGADPVIFIGQDLAYTGGMSHAADVGYEEAAFASMGRFSSRETKARRELARATMRIPAWGGRGEVGTNRVMWGYLRWLEATKAEGFGRGRTWIDASEGGAAKRGFVEKTLAEALAALPKDAAEAGRSEIAELARTARRVEPTSIREAMRRIEGDLEAVARRGDELLSRAREGFSPEAACAEAVEILAALRRDAFPAEQIGLKHLRAAWRIQDPIERAAVLGRLVREVVDHLVGRLRLAA